MGRLCRLLRRRANLVVLVAIVNMNSSNKRMEEQRIGLYRQRRWRRMGMMMKEKEKERGRGKGERGGCPIARAADNNISTHILLFLVTRHVDGKKRYGISSIFEYACLPFVVRLFVRFMCFWWMRRWSCKRAVYHISTRPWGFCMLISTWLLCPLFSLPPPPYTGGEAWLIVIMAWRWGLACLHLELGLFFFFFFINQSPLLVVLCISGTCLEYKPSVRPGLVFVLFLWTWLILTWLAVPFFFFFFFWGFRLFLEMLYVWHPDTSLAIVHLLFHWFDLVWLEIGCVFFFFFFFFFFTVGFKKI